MKQTNVSKYILPDGVNFAISTDSGSSYDDVGLLAAGATFTHNFDKEETNGGNKNLIIDRIKNQKLEFAPSALWSQDLAVFAKFGIGLYTNTPIAAVLVSGAEQVVASGAWAYAGTKSFIKIANQNFDKGAITINSVTGSVDGALDLNDDYFLQTDVEGNRGIYIVDGTNTTTEAQTITIDYDYTPAASNKITAGASNATLTKFIVRLRHYTDEALTTYDMEAFIYSTSMNSGLNINFKGQNEDGLFETTVAFTGNLDENRTSGDQLFSWLVATSALN